MVTGLRINPTHVQTTSQRYTPSLLTREEVDLPKNAKSCEPEEPTGLALLAVTQRGVARLSCFAGLPPRS